VDLLAANDSNIEIISKGQRILTSNITLPEAYVTPSISQGIVSPQLMMRDNNTSILFTNEKAYIFPNNFEFDKLELPIIQNKSTLLLAKLDPLNNLYTVSCSNSTNTCPVPPSKSVSTFRRYATAKFSNIADAVNFWHCCLGHPDSEIMIKCFESNELIKKLNPSLTPAAIRKYILVRIVLLEIYRINIHLLFQFWMIPRDPLLKWISRGSGPIALGNRRKHFRDISMPSRLLTRQQDLLSVGWRSHD
jgi:hypothetical protein